MKNAPSYGSQEQATPARSRQPRIGRVGYRSLWLVVHLLVRVLFRLRVEGKHNLPDGPFILSPVHRSFIDTPIVGVMTGKRLRFMGKETLWTSKPLGSFLTVMGGFPVERGSADRRALRAAEDVLALGEPLVMFPEGTRQEGPRLSREQMLDGPAFVALRTFFNWALREQFVDASPMAGMRAPSVLPARDRVLSDRELAEVCRVARGHPYPFGPIVALLILTGQRRGEIAALDWDWIDEDERRITLPASLTKNKHTHVFPYGNTVDEMLRGLPRVGKYLFPSRVETGTVFNGWGKSKARFDKGLSNVEPYTLHDLRRTFSSTLAGLGTPIHVTEKLLNHISGTVSGVAAIYNRHSYMAEMRAAIGAYEEHLAKLVGRC